MVDIERLPAGESVVYATTKNLARARLTTQIEIADAAWEAALRGEVDLVQRRLPNGQIAYLAVGRHRVDKNPVKPAIITPNYRKSVPDREKGPRRRPV